MAHSIKVYSSDGAVPPGPTSEVDLSSATYGITLLKAQIQDMADMVVTPVPKGGRGGVSTQGAKPKAKFLNLVLLLEASASGTDSNILADRVRRMNALKMLLDPRKGELFYQLDREVFSVSDLDAGYWARLHAPIQVDEKGVGQRTFQLNLIAPDGVRYSPTKVTQNVTIDANPKSGISIPDSGNVIGSAPAHPVYTFTNTDSTTLASMSFTVVSTLFGVSTTQSITMTGLTFAQNDKIRVDADRETIEQSTDGGSTWSSILSSLNAAGVFPLLAPAASSTLSISGFVAGTLAIEYYPEFL